MKLQTILAVAVLTTASASQAHAQMRFQGMDRNRDGVITRAEWRGSDTAFWNQDWNGDGVLSGDEVRPGARRPDYPRSYAGAQGGPRRQFPDFDRNGDGWITRNEWQMGAADFNRIDVNRDNRISAFEFRSYLDRTYQSPVETGRRNRAVQSGYDRGLSEGRQAGREDYVNRHGWDLDGQTEMERADSGYSSQLGALGDYQSGYRDGFRVGYREGFDQR